MLQRTLTTVIGAPALLILLFWSGWSWTLLVIALALLALAEFYNACRLIDAAPAEKVTAGGLCYQTLKVTDDSSDQAPINAFSVYTSFADLELRAPRVERRALRRRRRRGRVYRGAQILERRKLIGRALQQASPLEHTAIPALGVGSHAQEPRRSSRTRTEPAQPDQLPQPLCLDPASPHQRAPARSSRGTAVRGQRSGRGAGTETDTPTHGP